MKVTRLEPGFQKKVKVFIDDEYGFLLYTGDIRRYKLEEDMELPDELYHQIIEETVYRRARQKALAILKRSDRTELELRQKLKQAEYTEEIINRTLAYINSYHYLDDKRYAQNYFTYKKSSKSSKQIRMELVQKGIDKEMINNIMEEEGYSEEEAIQKAIRKKTQDIDALSFEQKQKIAAYLYRKGFSQEMICKFINFR
jgi:regulatory protein